MADDAGVDAEELMRANILKADALVDTAERRLPISAASTDAPQRGATLVAADADK
jgi:hypothetical protein